MKRETQSLLYLEMLYTKINKVACFAYLIFVKDSFESANSLKSDTSSSSQEEITHKEFLNEFSDCFKNSI